MSIDKRKLIVKHDIFDLMIRAVHGGLMNKGKMEDVLKNARFIVQP
jgi:hypothetical protein